jgi:hypothetical protein
MSILTIFRTGILSILLVASAAVDAQEPAPPGADLVAFAARRFPQPVRAGDLIDRAVLEPIESRPVLGHVLRVIRAKDGTVEIVIQYGGIFGWGARPIAVPAVAMALLGRELEILDFTPLQLNEFATFDATGTTTIAADDQIRMGLAHPSH